MLPRPTRIYRHAFPTVLIAATLMALIFSQLFLSPRIAVAQSDVLKVELTGTVVVVEDIYCQCLIVVEVGGAVTGYYTYDLTASDGNPDPSIGLYEYNALPNEIVLRVGAHLGSGDRDVPAHKNYSGGLAGCLHN